MSSENRKKYLVYSSIKDTRTVTQYQNIPNVDIAIVFYGDDEAVFEEIQKNPQCTYSLRRKGFKIDNFLFLVKQYPEILEYEYILFADDDIRIEKNDTEKLFRKVQELNVDYAQPVHSKKSFLPFLYFLRQRPGVQYEFVNLLEIQFFVLKTDFIKETLKHWEIFSTGYCLNVFLSLYLKEKENSMALIHEIAVLHPYKNEEDTVRVLKKDFTQCARNIEHFLCEFYKIPPPLLKNMPHFKAIKTFKNGKVSSALVSRLQVYMLRVGSFLRINKYRVVYDYEKEQGKERSVVGTFFHFIRWAWAQTTFTSPLKKKVPWMSFRMHDYLKNFLSTRKNVRVFEFGSGGSTLLFLKKNCTVTSIEHDLHWQENVQKKVKRNQKHRSTITHYPVDAENQTSSEELYHSQHPDFQGRSFEKYANAINSEEDNSYDIINVDGRARIACLKNAVRKLKDGGILILDDTYRSRYQRAEKYIPKDWKKEVITGPGPWSWGCLIKETTVYTKAR